MGSPTESFRPLDPEELSKEAKEVAEFISDYYRKVEHFPVRSQVQPGYLWKLLPHSAPAIAEPLDAILEDIRTDIFPGMTHWQSPNFFAYFPASASTAGFVGEMLCSGLSVVGFNWVSSPAATELESIVMDWMAKLLKLPPAFHFSAARGGGGVLHDTTCEAIVCTIAAARDRALETMSPAGISALAIYVSDQTHFTVQKAAKLVGIPPANLRVIPTSASSGNALTAESVRSVMEADVAAGLVPLYLCATVGSTAVGAVDPLPELGEVAREFGVWLHVDAAYAGPAGICPEFRQYFDGVELADSMSMNLHKWFLSNLLCCCLWVKSSAALVNSLSTEPEILRNKASEERLVVDYKDWQIALSRRFRALKLWVVIRRFGVENMREHIRSSVDMAKKFEHMVVTDRRFKMMAPRRFSLVCFRLAAATDEENMRLLEAVNGSGRAFMTHAVVGGAFALRLSVGTSLTELRHVEATWRLIQEKADEILEPPACGGDVEANSQEGE